MEFRASHSNILEEVAKKKGSAKSSVQSHTDLY